MKLDYIDYVIIAVGGALISVVIFGGWNAHHNDDQLKAACEAKGGTFIEARQPLHLCVVEVK